MSSQLDKLKSLLTRVEERRGQPRLRAVPAAQPAERISTLPDLPAAAAVERTGALPDRPTVLTPERPTILAPARPAAAVAAERAAAAAATGDRVSAVPERAPKPVTPTPLEDAMAELPSVGLPGDATPVPGLLPAALMVEPEPLQALKQQQAPARPGVTLHGLTPMPKLPQAPEPADDLFDMDPFAPSVAPEALTTPPPAGARAPAQATPTPMPAAMPTTPAPAPALASAPVQLSAPSARVVPQRAPAAAPVAKLVSPHVPEAPKTFGDLVERTLALRPRE